MASGVPTASDQRGTPELLPERQLIDLTSALGSLLASVEDDRLPHAIVNAARRLVQADAAAVWLLSDGRWYVAAQDGLSDAYTHEAIAVGTPVAFDEPVAIGDVTTSQMLEGRRASYEREGVRAVLIVPLRIGGRNSGTVVLYHRRPREFSEIEVRMAAALGQVAASAVHIADLYAKRQAAAQRAAFLAQAGVLLSTTLDVKSTLTQVAALAVPHIADWCGVHLVRPDGTIEQLVAAHVDPDKVRWADRLSAEYPPDPTADSGLAQVIRSGEPQLMPVVPRELLEASARDEAHLEILRALDIRSLLIVPMGARGQAVGAITFVATSESGRTFGGDDLELAQALASRAALAIDNARLYQEARDANQLKDDFFATLSHELRTPINAVLGWAQLLSENLLDEQVRARAVQSIARNARAQAQLLTDILELSRIVSGKVQLQVERVDLGALAAELVESLRPSFDARRQTVDAPPAGGPWVEADRPRLQQVLFNLLSNAGKFTPDGGHIAVDVAGLEDVAEIRVSDNGAGIAASFLPYVFERFRQADSSSTREHGGLGIGLAVARHIVELHGGTITAASEGLGSGATFSVRLPLEHRAAAARST